LCQAHIPQIRITLTEPIQRSATSLYQPYQLQTLKSQTNCQFECVHNAALNIEEQRSQEKTCKLRGLERLAQQQRETITTVDPLATYADQEYSTNPHER